MHVLTPADRPALAAYPASLQHAALALWAPLTPPARPRALPARAPRAEKRHG